MHIHSPSALVMRNVHAPNPDGQSLVDFSMSIERGAFHGLLGNGSAGKTLVARIAMGLVSPESGDVAVLGANPVPRRTSYLKRVGYQAQRPAFFPRTTVLEHLRTVAGVYGTSDHKVSILLEALLLEECVNTRVERLDVSERQRLAIATSVVHQPEFLVLDEPTYPLEVAARSNLISILRSSNVAGTTTLYLTRHLDELEKLCDSVTVLSGGSDVLHYTSRSDDSVDASAHVGGRTSGTYVEATA